MVSTIVTNILASFNSMLTGIGSAVVSIFTDLIIVLDCGPDGLCGVPNEADDFYTLSDFGLWLTGMMGIMLAIAVIAKILNKIL